MINQQQLEINNQEKNIQTYKQLRENARVVLLSKFPYLSHNEMTRLIDALLEPFEDYMVDIENTANRLGIFLGYQYSLDEIERARNAIDNS